MLDRPVGMHAWPVGIHGRPVGPRAWFVGMHGRLVGTHDCRRNTWEAGSNAGRQEVKHWDQEEMLTIIKGFIITQRV